MDYTNIPIHGFDIAERYAKRAEDGSRSPAVLRRAWFSHLSEAEAWMAARDHKLGIHRIVDCQTGRLVPWRGTTGEGENAISKEDWLACRDEQGQQLLKPLFG